MNQHAERQESTFFKGAAHQHRFFATMQQLDKLDDGKLDPEYAAAVYVLTSDKGTWEKAQEYTGRSGIDFESLLEEVDWSGGYSVLITWASNLFNGNTHIDPVELMRLDESNFQLALSALQLRRSSCRVDGFKKV